MLVKEQSTQTENDLLYKEALSIVTNFQTIERYWQKTERINQLLLITTLGLGASLLLLINLRRKHG